MTEAHPLNWPAHRTRTPSYRQERSRFRVSSFAVVRDELFRELKLLGAKSVVLSSNIPLRNDGMPYASFRKVDDTGAAVYFQYKGKGMCFACDRWERVEDNIQAIRHTIGALRGITRWGSGDMLEAAFTGFQALPAPNAPARHWTSVLDVPAGATASEIMEGYRRMAKKYHPDAAGGSHERMAEINAALELCKREGRVA